MPLINSNVHWENWNKTKIYKNDTNLIMPESFDNFINIVCNNNCYI
jgi:hypothetical protein